MNGTTKADIEAAGGRPSDEQRADVLPALDAVSRHLYRALRDLVEAAEADGWDVTPNEAILNASRAALARVSP